jgi:hypothetical protein
VVCDPGSLTDAGYNNSGLVEAGYSSQNEKTAVLNTSESAAGFVEVVQKNARRTIAAT